jgi:uncharacterized protein YbjT (DUF2867 family)
MKEHAVVIGATGAVGSALTRELLGSASWEGVAILTRKPTELFAGCPGAQKLSRRVVDLARLEEETAQAARGAGAAFCTMGIGQPRKVSREELWRVEVELAAAFARGSRSAGVRHFSLMTSVGADAASRSYYLRVKGTAEERVKALGFDRVSFFRPSLLVTREIRYGLQDRLTQALYPMIAWMLPSRFRGVRVEDLARAMRLWAEAPAGPPVRILHYEDFLRISR